MTDNILKDGQLTLTIVDSAGAETPVQADLITLKLECEACEDQHSLQAVDGALKPTTAFLADLATRLESINFPTVTPTIAWQVWTAAGKAMTVLKKNMSATPTSLLGTESTPPS